MQDKQTLQDVHPKSPYYPWTSLVIGICDDEDCCPGETIHRFWDKYMLPEATIQLYQLLMALKGKERQRPTEEEALNTYFRDLCKALISFAYLTRYAPEQIIFLKPQTTKSNAKR